MREDEEKKRCWKTGIEVKIMQKSLWQRTEASPAAPHKGWRDMAEGLRAAGDGRWREVKGRERGLGLEKQILGRKKTNKKSGWLEKKY